MMNDTSALPDECRVALAYARRPDLAGWTALLRLDMRLGEIVRTANEPLLAQIKLVWWRDQLLAGNPVSGSTDPLLREVATRLPDAGARLAELASAWEHLLSADALTTEGLAQYLDARAAGYGALANLIQRSDEQAAIIAAARWWAAGDTLLRLPDPGEREALFSAAAALPAPPRLSRPLRPLAILAALGRRAVQTRSPVLGDRIDALVALRVGMFGR